MAWLRHWVARLQDGATSAKNDNVLRANGAVRPPQPDCLRTLGGQAADGSDLAFERVQREQPLLDGTDLCQQVGEGHGMVGAGGIGGHGGTQGAEALGKPAQLPPQHPPELEAMAFQLGIPPLRRSFRGWPGPRCGAGAGRADGLTQPVPGTGAGQGEQGGRQQKGLLKIAPGLAEIDPGAEQLRVVGVDLERGLQHLLGLPGLPGRQQAVAEGAQQRQVAGIARDCAAVEGKGSGRLAAAEQQLSHAEHGGEVIGLALEDGLQNLPGLGVLAELAQAAGGGGLQVGVLLVVAQGLAEEVEGGGNAGLGLGGLRLLDTVGHFVHRRSRGRWAMVA